MLATRSPALIRIYRKMSRILHSHAPVLLRGETGCGKEMMAQALHHAGLPRLQKLLLVQCDRALENSLPQKLFDACAAIPRSCNSNGNSASAQNSTLGVSILLKNVETLSPGLQLWFVQLLQNKFLRAPESGVTLALSFRLLATSRFDLLQYVEQERFRQDLYYRLSTYEFVLPPLRERKEDLPDLVAYFLRKATAQNPEREMTCSDRVLDELLAHSWPGNIRELKETLARALVRHGQQHVKIEEIEFLTQEDCSKESSRRNGFASQIAIHERTCEPVRV